MPDFKSKFEAIVYSQLGEGVTYETDRIAFIQPAKKRFYKPDFKLAEKVYLETKGKWDSADRQKHVWLKEQHPDINIYLLFQNANQKLSKKSTTTYGDWATKNGLLWANHKEGIPEEWLKHVHQENKKCRAPTQRRSRDSN